MHNLKTTLLLPSSHKNNDEILREIIILQSLSRRNTDHHRLSAQAHPSLTEHDILAFAAPQKLYPTQARLQQIASRLDTLTDSLLQYIPLQDGEILKIGHPFTAKEILLFDKVQSLSDNVQSKHNENVARLKRLNQLLDHLSTTYDLLYQTLEKTTEAFPPQLHSLAAAHGDHVSAVIEASLVKIYLLRARALRSVYGTKSQTQPNNEGTVASAISVAYRKLKADEARMREEERQLDQKLSKYEELLTVVDGGQGGFQQVVNDWTRVKKETEDCRTDLRRLGWTGD